MKRRAFIRTLAHELDTGPFRFGPQADPYAQLSDEEFLDCMVERASRTVVLAGQGEASLEELADARPWVERAYTWDSVNGPARSTELLGRPEIAKGLAT